MIVGFIGGSSRAEGQHHSATTPGSTKFNNLCFLLGWRETAGALPAVGAGPIAIRADATTSESISSRLLRKCGARDSHEESGIVMSEGDSGS
jgi:hypothetical protein